MSLYIRCPKCQASVPATYKYCDRCAQPLGAISARLTTPEHLARRIVAAEAENKLATVLFADMVDSTGIIDRLGDPEKASRFLVAAVDAMAEVVHRYEGIVVRDRGDGIVASFGAPVALEDHAVRACYAALDMQKKIRLRGKDLARDLREPPQIRIGINSGDIVVTVKHEEGKAREIRLDGMVVHVAARVEELASPGTILLTKETLALAEGFVRGRMGGMHQVKGVRQPVQVVELDGVNTRMRIQALAARGLSKFVGRQHEMQALQRAAAQAFDAKGQVLALVGEAGVGKSRVFLEFIHSSAMAKWLVLEAGSVSYGKATSYLPLVDLLTRYFDIHAQDDETRVREKIVARLSGLGEERLLAQTPVFLGVLGIGSANDLWDQLAPAERQRTLFAALKRLFVRESRRQPLCLVFEDLHWVDAETQAFLELLSESIPAARVLLLVNYRPEHQVGWAGRSYFSQIRIDPLGGATADELLDELLGSHPDLAQIKRALITVTEGNPLFLEESVRSLIEGEVLSGKPGDWRPRGSVPAGFVPPTIEALLAARIDRLRPELKEILQCASVVGSDVPLPLLEAVTAMPRSEIERAIRELQAADFLYEKALFPETEYTFKHAMTREVAYASMLAERRQALHARAAHALEELAAGRVEEHVERIAQHAYGGRLWEMALDYLQRAGTKAFGLYANTEAAVFFERALQVLAEMPESRAKLEQGVDIRFNLRNALIALCELRRIKQVLQEVEPLLSVLEDKVRAARHAAFQCNHYFLAAEQRAAIEAGKRGLALAAEQGDRRVQGELLYRLGQSYHQLGDNRRAIDLLQQSLEFTVEQREHNRFELSVIPAVVNRTWLVSVLAECGEFALGNTHAKRALQIAEEADHPLSQVLGWLAVGHVLRRKGELDGAIGALERGMSLCDRYVLPMWRLRLVSSLGIAYARRGRTDEGVGLARQALEDAQRMSLMVDQPMMQVRLGQALMVAGNVQDALDCGRRALELAIAHEAKCDEAWARFLIGRARWAADPPHRDEAETQLNAALRLARACEAKPLAAFCLATLGSISADTSAAQEFASAAEAIYAELDMRPLPPVR